MPQYMIHASPERMWYVEGYLIPSMKAQGIREADITVWNDRQGKGNLASCLESFGSVARAPGGTWHLQDDVILSRSFAQATRDNNEGVVCGFYCRNFGPIAQAGRVPVRFMWYSFQCLRLPNALAGEFVEWFHTDGKFRPCYKDILREGKGDDSFFRDFVLEKHPELWVTNLAPCIADHIDFLIGGTLVNQARLIQVNRAEYWNDEDLVRQLEDRLRNEKR